MIVYMDRASIESLTVKDIREIVVKQSLPDEISETGTLLCGGS